MVQKRGITVVLHPKTHENTMEILQIDLKCLITLHLL